MYDYTEVLFLVGRVLFGGFFLMTGLRHYMNTDMLAGYAQSKGVPSPRVAVLSSGLLILAGGLGVLLGAYVPWAVAALVLFLVLVSFKMHAYWTEAEPMKSQDMQNFMKNMALLGGALMLLMIPEPWAYSLLGY